ncbi:hypothetical protein [Pleurocapsa sp. FMAR1]|uniref:hypothetical protein n=1 Tax=Pleurocapsa sp. FMAR1 TaxID=3040204 RepID=UPI0029C7A87F|nr:hypothetical protein [Pleurocapsa sp. FMAR1]
MQKPKLINKSIRVDEREYEKLSAIATSKGATGAGIIRMLIAQYLEQAEVVA